jgi:hypothetical protein
VGHEWSALVRHRTARDALWVLQTVLPLAAVDITTEPKARAALSPAPPDPGRAHLLAVLERPHGCLQLLGILGPPSPSSPGQSAKTSSLKSASLRHLTCWYWRHLCRASHRRDPEEEGGGEKLLLNVWSGPRHVCDLLLSFTVHRGQRSRNLALPAWLSAVDTLHSRLPALAPLADHEVLALILPFATAVPVGGRDHDIGMFLEAYRELYSNEGVRRSDQYPQERVPVPASLAPTARCSVSGGGQGREAGLWVQLAWPPRAEE